MVLLIQAKLFLLLLSKYRTTVVLKKQLNIKCDCGARRKGKTHCYNERFDRILYHEAEEQTGKDRVDGLNMAVVVPLTASF